MSFIIERSHVIFKHLIHLGPEINVESVAELATQKDYLKETRQIATPTGPLKEYLFRSKTNPLSLIVYSSKGFVIDAQPTDNVLALFRDAYDFYEKVLGELTMTATVIMEINCKFEVFSPKAIDELLTQLYIQNTQTILWNNKEFHPGGVILVSGSGKFPEESIQLTIQPLPKDPQKRLIAMVLYRSTELDDALKFIETINDEIKTILLTLSEIKQE